jgi:uncharacterized protein (UPF0335 family)
MTKDHYDGAILEDIQSQIQRLAESMADVPKKVIEIDERLKSVEADVKVIKAVVTDHEKEIQSIKKHPKLKLA